MLREFRKLSKTFVAKALFGLLILAFAVWGVNGLTSSHMRNVAATVGGQKVMVNDLYNAVQSDLMRLAQIQRQALSPEQIQQLGLVQRNLSNLIVRALLQESAADFGLVTTHDSIINKLRNDPALQNPDGSFNKTAFVQALSDNRMTEHKFFQQVAAELTQDQLVNSLFSNAPLSGAMLRVVHDFLYETRDGQYVVIKAASLLVDTADEATLRDFYEKNKQQFVQPELRTFDYVTLTPKDVEKQINVSDEELREIYAANQAAYTGVEKRDLQQLVFADKAAADAALQDIREKDLSLLEAQTAHQAAGPEMTTVTGISRDELPEAQQEMVFGAEPGDIVGPLEGPFGWALVEVTSTTAPSTESFESVKEGLRKSVLAERSGEALYQMGNQFEDMVAGGASLEDAAKELGFTIQTVEQVTAGGNFADRSKDAFEEKDLLATAYGLTKDEVSTLQEFGDGRAFYFVQVRDIQDASIQPYEKVEAGVAKLWKQVEQGKKATSMVQQLLEKVEKDGQSFTSAAKGMGLSLASVKAVSRGEPDKDLARPIHEALFNIPAPGNVLASQGQEGLFVVELTKVTPAAAPSREVLEKLAPGLKEQNANILFDLYKLSLQDDYNVDIKEKSIEAAFQ